MVSGSQLQVANLAQMRPAAASGSQRQKGAPSGAQRRPAAPSGALLPAGAPSSTKISLELIILFFHPFYVLLKKNPKNL